MGKPRVPSYLEIGIVSRPHGITGEVKVKTSPEFLESLQGVKHVYLDESSDGTILVSQRIHQNAILIKLAGVNTRTAAEGLRGKRIRIKTLELPRLHDGQYYSHELVGMRVLDESAIELGVLQEVLATGSNDVYVIKQPNGKELLLPAIESVIRAMNLETATMTVVLPPGLVE